MLALECQTPEFTLQECDREIPDSSSLHDHSEPHSGWRRVMSDEWHKSKVKFGKQRKDINREIRSKLANINKNLLPNSREKLRKNMGAVKTGKSNSLSLENVSNGRPPARARSRTTPNPPPVRARKPEPPQKTPAPESARKPVVVPTPSAPIQPAKTEDDKTQIVDGESTWDLSHSSSSKRAKEKKKEPVVKKNEKGTKNTKPYTDKQLKDKVAKLHKKTQALRAEDPEVDRLIAGVKESLATIEALNKLYIEIYQEAKTRTKRLVDDFEHLKATRQQHFRDLDAQIAQQVRAEVDARKELEEMLKDSNFRSLPKSHSSRQRKQPIEQPSYVASLLRSIFGF